MTRPTRERFVSATVGAAGCLLAPAYSFAETAGHLRIPVALLVALLFGLVLGWVVGTMLSQQEAEVPTAGDGEGTEAGEGWPLALRLVVAAFVLAVVGLLWVFDDRGRASYVACAVVMVAALLPALRRLSDRLGLEA